MQHDLLEKESSEFCHDDKIRIEIPYPPTVNHATGYRVQLPSVADMAKAFSGDWKDFFKWLRKKVFVQTYKTQETKDFIQQVWSAVTRLNARKRWPNELKMSMYIHPPDRRRRDSSNLWKMVEDALMAAEVYIDDSQIIEHQSFKSNPVKGGLVIVEIETLV